MSLERKDEHDHRAWLKEKDLSVIEKTYLMSLIWLDKRFRVVDYLELLEDMYYKVNLQMPKSHTEQYNLDNKFWYWYPLYALGSFSGHRVSDRGGQWRTAWVLLCTIDSR